MAYELTPKDGKYIKTINQKNSDGTFTSYPIGAEGKNVVLESGINVEKQFKNIQIELDKGNLLVEVTLLENRWKPGPEGKALWVQTVEDENISDRNALLVNLVGKNTSPEEQSVYSQNFSILASGYAETADGSVTFWVYSKPTADITVGIVLGNLPIPADVPLWHLSDDGEHVELKDQTKILQGGAEPKEGKDLITVDFGDERYMVKGGEEGFVKKVGDTMTGALRMPGTAETDPSATYSNESVTITKTTTDVGEITDTTVVSGDNVKLTTTSTVGGALSYTNEVTSEDISLTAEENEATSTLNVSPFEVTLTDSNGNKGSLEADGLSLTNKTGDGFKVSFEEKQVKIKDAKTEALKTLQVAEPKLNDDATTKKYVTDNFLGNDSMQTLKDGPLVIESDSIPPSLVLKYSGHVVNISMDEKGSLTIAGGEVDVASNDIILSGIADPTLDNNAVNKKYLDDLFHAYVIIPGQHMYEGRDLSTRGYQWDDFKQMSRTGDYKDIIVGDYMTIEVNGEQVQPQIAGIDCYYNTGGGEVHGAYDTRQMIPVPHHIDWISKDCLSKTYAWNSTGSNNAPSPTGQDDGTDVPWLQSTIKASLDGIWSSLPEDLRSVVINKVNLLERRGQSGQSLTQSSNWHWYPMGSLWLPLEIEVFGTNIWSQQGYGSGQAMQYPLFANSWKHRIKGLGKDGFRYTWWLASVSGFGATTGCSVSGDGIAAWTVASTLLAVPLCFRTAYSQKLS